MLQFIENQLNLKYWLLSTSIVFQSLFLKLINLQQVLFSFLTLWTLTQWIFWIVSLLEYLNHILPHSIRKYYTWFVISMVFDSLLLYYLTCIFKLLEGVALLDFFLSIYINRLPSIWCLIQFLLLILNSINSWNVGPPTISHNKEFRVKLIQIQNQLLYVKVTFSFNPQMSQPHLWNK